MHRTFEFAFFPGDLQLFIPGLSKSKKAALYVGAYENAMIQMARDRKAAGIITGQIHQPAMFERDGITYYKPGDWVDHCTLLAEHRDGSLELLTWDEQNFENSEIRMLKRSPSTAPTIRIS